jgi:WD40-like Beta Propeller Repeat
LDGARPQLLVQADSAAVFAPPGYLLFVREGGLWAQPLDDRTFRPRGPPVLTSAHVFVGFNGDLHLSVSRTDVLAFSVVQLTSQQLAWYDRGGRRVARVGEPMRDEENIDLSHDGRYAVVSSGVVQPGSTTVEGLPTIVNVWAIDTTTGIRTRVTSGNGWDKNPVWSPDGREIAFGSFRKTPRHGTVSDLFRKRFGGVEERPLFTSDENKYPKQWLADGSILFIHEDGKALFRLWPSGGTAVPLKPVEDEFHKDNFRVSPDESHVAFNSPESSRWEVYVADFPSFANRRPISVSGGVQPHGAAMELSYSISRSRVR